METKKDIKTKFNMPSSFSSCTFHFFINIGVYSLFQRVFLLMGKQAAERHTLWLE